MYKIEEDMLKIMFSLILYKINYLGINPGSKIKLIAKKERKTLEDG